MTLILFIHFYASAIKERYAPMPQEPTKQLELLQQSIKKVVPPTLFTKENFILPNKMTFLNNTTRNYVTDEVLEAITKQPEGSIIKHAYRMTDGKIYFYSMTPSRNDSSEVITNPPFATIDLKTSQFTHLDKLEQTSVTGVNRQKRKQEVVNLNLMENPQYSSAQQLTLNLNVLKNRYYENPVIAMGGYPSE